MKLSDRRIMSVKNVPSDNFKIRIGTLNRRNPETFFIEGGTYVAPKSDVKPINERRIRTEIAGRIRGDANLTEKYIITIDFSKDRFKEDKWSYIGFQVHTRQKTPKAYNTLLDIPSNIATDIATIIQKELDRASFHYSKTNKKQTIISPLS